MGKYWSPGNMASHSSQVQSVTIIIADHVLHSSVLFICLRGISISNEPLHHHYVGCCCFVLTGLLSQTRSAFD